ncbi:DUF418 domain-containing protein [Bacillus safensis]|uniref:DUF418 domain-containing protein n=1 Tax=Bacillus safensis TaxID=561879 RepID=UPI0037F29227
MTLNKVKPDAVKKKKEVKRGSNTSKRLIALDAVRGLAVIGMFLQHFAMNEWNATIVSGNTTLLFVLCGGISYSIMAQRMLERGTEPFLFRARMLARAVFIDLVGYTLILLNTPYGVILPAYAALFVLALVLINHRLIVLVWTTAILLVISPPLMIIGGSLLAHAYLLQDIAGGSMSALALAPAFLAGMVIGRLDMSKVSTASTCLGIGLIFFMFSKVMGTFFLPRWSHSFENWLVQVLGTSTTEADQYAIWPLNVEQPLWHTLLSIAPHSASTFQTMLGLGLSLIVLGIFFLIPSKGHVLLKPFAAVGRVALTMYSAQFVVVWICEHAGIQYSLGEMPFGDLIVAMIAIIAGLLITRMPSGPLESAMRRFDQLFTTTSKTLTDKQAKNQQQIES